MFEITSNSKLWETKLKQLNANLESLVHATNHLGSLDSVFAAGIALPKPPKAQQIRGAIVRKISALWPNSWLLVGCCADRKSVV